MARFQVEYSLAKLLQHLGLREAHFAARLDTDWTGLVANRPELVASLTLVCPPSLNADALRPLASRLLVFSDDQPSGLRMAQALTSLPDATLVTLDEYSGLPWTDVAADRIDLIGPTMLNFLARMETTGQRRLPEGEGQIDELTYCIFGSGPPLVLLPLSLAPSQWSPLLPLLAERYCTITLSGAAVGFVSMLETRGRSGYLRVVRSVLDEIPLQPGESILEVGCGSGVLSRWLAHRTGKANPIVALDLNTYLLREAELLAADEGLSGIIEFREGNAERLPFPDNRFHATLAFTVLEEGPADRILAEMIRVTKPGGHIAVVVRSRDMPWLVNLALPAVLTMKVEAPYPGSVAQGGCADRSLYLRAKKAGLIELQTMPQLASYSGPVGYHYLDRLEASLSEEEASVWRDAMRQAEADHTLFIAQPFHCAVGKKP